MMDKAEIPAFAGMTNSLSSWATTQDLRLVKNRATNRFPHTHRFGLFVFSAGFYDTDLMMGMAEIPAFAGMT